MGQQAGPARPKEFQCDSLSAAGVAAAAGFAEICLQFAEADTVNQSGEHKFSARWTKVMGTAEWKASRTRRWFKGLKPTVILLSRGISDAESSRRAGQGWQRKGRLRSVVWARTKPPPSECDELEGGWWAKHHFCHVSERLPDRAGQQELQRGRWSPLLDVHQRF